ncbi:hypothetical protein N183_23235 [Sinorhizobium sp. Sb3]|nr:hypothetical protein N183_23235 [Sinorhizobium sp. Sb3]
MSTRIATGNGRTPTVPAITTAGATPAIPGITAIEIITATNGDKA